MSTEQSGILVDASELGEVFKELERRVPGGTRAALGEIANIMVGLVEDEFQSEGRGEWPPFALETFLRRRPSASPKLLQDTGIAAGSVSPEVEHDAAVAFTNVPYMIYHTSAEPRHVIPYRNPFDFPIDDLLEQASDISLASLTQWGQP